MTTADQMATAMGGQMSDAVAMARAGGAFRAHETGLKLSVDIAETTEVVPSHNLIARITGTTRPDEYVVYSAHWDHVGTAPEPDATGDSIFNGAWDNASGTSGVMEMARAFKEGTPPERTVIFLHVTAEEQGLLGSQWYAVHPVYPLEKTAANINIDMLPFTPATKTIAIFGPGKSTLEDDLATLAAEDGRSLTGDGEPEQGFYYRSDHFSFAKRGVPMFAVDRGTDLVTGGKAAGAAISDDFTNVRYHQPSDEYQESWDMSGMKQDVTLFFRLGRELADGTSWPNWHAGDEFRAIRDKSRADAGRK
jgi:Zn-dependent M28 family amino/carboxypeptidase